MEQAKCSAIGCSEPATRVIHGRDYCSRHNEGHRTPEVPTTVCAINGCGSPAVTTVGGLALCSYHAGHWPDRAAA